MTHFFRDCRKGIIELGKERYCLIIISSLAIYIIVDLLMEIGFFGYFNAHFLAIMDHFIINPLVLNFIIIYLFNFVFSYITLRIVQLFFKRFCGFKKLKPGFCEILCTHQISNLNKLAMLTAFILPFINIIIKHLLFIWTFKFIYP